MSALGRAACAAGVVLALCTAGSADAQVAVRGETIYTMDGAPIRDGVVLIGANGRIERVGTAAQVAIPSGYRTLSARVVTPGLVDAHTVVGLAFAHAHCKQPESSALDYTGRDFARCDRR